MKETKKNTSDKTSRTTHFAGVFAEPLSLGELLSFARKQVGGGVVD